MMRSSKTLWSNFSSETNRSEEATFVAGAAEKLALDDRDLPAGSRKSRAKAGPACPVPMMIAWYSCMTPSGNAGARCKRSAQPAARTL
jgi:hypothetical protein